MLDYKLFVQNLTMLAEVYERDISKPVINTYYEVLKTLSDDDFKFSVRKILSERTYATFPKPAEFISMANVKVELSSPSDNKNNALEEQAKELIDLVHSLNGSVYRDHIKTGIPFDTLLEKVSFPSVDDETIAILNQVKPYCDFKTLICNINAYQTSKDALNAFKSALSKGSGTAMIESVEVRKLIKKG